MTSLSYNIHGYEGRLRRSLSRLREELPAEDAELVEEFISACLAEEIRDGRCARYAQNLKRIMLLMEKPLSEADRRDVDGSLLAHYGLIEKEEAAPTVRPRRCPRCKALNSHDAQYCKQCSLVLDPKEALRLEKRRGEERQMKMIEELQRRIETLENGG